MLAIKRVYEAASPEDGYRILVDRLWPRGLRKEDASIDWWLKDIAPSPDLRTWFGHKPERFNEFSLRYQEELQDNPAVAELQEKITNTTATVTLLYGARDTSNNHAKVLLDFLNTHQGD